LDPKERSKKVSDDATTLMSSLRERGHVITADEHERLITLAENLVALFENRAQDSGTADRLANLEQSVESLIAATANHR
jgi:hypothetical protein